MKPFRWSSEKNEILKNERGISFESIVVAIESGGLLDIVAHPNQDRYPRQRVLVVAYGSYAYLVPFVEEPDYFSFKTIIPSRKATRDFLRQVRQMAEIDDYELEILSAFEEGKLKSVASKSELDRIKAAARATAIKDRRVNIRLSSSDLSDIQARALEEGIPYQTLIASVLHKYVTGRLAEKPDSATGRRARVPKRRGRSAS